eukprot:SAG11_NODE_9936_length_868_cov_1.910273_1_plen_88_part_01
MMSYRGRDQAVGVGRPQVCALTLLLLIFLAFHAFLALSGNSTKALLKARGHSATAKHPAFPAAGAVAEPQLPLTASAAAPPTARPAGP